MFRLGVIACGVLFLSFANCAYSAPAESPPSSAVDTASSIFSAPTVGDFLNDCIGNQSECVDEVGTALLDKMTLDGTAAVCLPSPDYAAGVLVWLDSHPETHNMPTEDGIYLTLKRLYPCG